MKTVRIIVPAFPEINIFTKQARRTTALGPIVVASAINKMPDFKVEVIDENNYSGPRDGKGLPDHSALQKDSPATIVGFYCGLTSTMERVWQLADFYKKPGIAVVAGGWHAHYCPEETLSHNVDVVVHGDAEVVISDLIGSMASGGSLENIPGISFKTDNGFQTNEPYMLENKEQESFPYPDFGLLRFARVKTYPIGRIRGCGMNCEFCSVKGKPRYASAEYLFNTVKWLVETRRARHFFIVDDRLEQDPEGTAEFFSRIYGEYGNRLCFSAQIRLETAKNIPLLEIMEKAGVRYVCVGYESPIDEDLKAMRKGYLSSNMIEWTQVLRRYFWVHGMFIVGYPKAKQSPIAGEEVTRRYKRFIRKARLDSIQVLLPVPIVGTDLRKRLGSRVFPLDLVPWTLYDGNHPCFQPDNMSARKLQDMGIKLMKGFYQKISLVRVAFRTVVFPADFFIRGWGKWHSGWERAIINYSGHVLVKRWLGRHKNEELLKKLEQQEDFERSRYGRSEKKQP